MTADMGSTQTARQPLEWSAKVIMLFGGLMVALALGAITSVLPQIDAALGRGPQDSLMIKQLVGIVGLSMVIGAPLAGFLVDRIGARSVVVAAALLYTVVGTAGLYLSDLPALIASRLLLGIMAVAITTTSMTMINTRLTGLERAKWMGLHVGAAMIGSIIVHPFAGYLGEFGWRWPFALYAIGLPMALIALGLDRGTVPRQRAAVANAGPANMQAGLLSWFPLRYLALAIVIGSITYLPMVYVPFLMTQMGVTSPTIIALVLTGDVLLGAGVALLYGRARRHFSTHAAFAVSFACAGVGMTIVALATNLFGVVIGMMMFGTGLGWFVPNLMTAVAQQVPLELQGRATGLVKGAHHLAAPLCLVVVEPFARRLGPQGAMMAAAALAFLLLVLMTYNTIAHRQRERAAALAQSA